MEAIAGRPFTESTSREPFADRLDDAGRLIGESRNTIYRLLTAGKLRAVKRGGSTLVLMDSIHEHMASLRPATFGADRADAAPE